MINRYVQVQSELRQDPKTWLVTGVAGFIGSHLLEALLKLNQRVVGLDNFGTGHHRNLNEVQTLVTPEQWAKFQFIQGDIRNLEDCRKAMKWTSTEESKNSTQFAVDHVLHQAALGSVPRSLADPIASNDTNVNGFLNIMVAAKDAQVQSFTYAASSSTYGDHPTLPKVEENIGKPLSPYAVTKYVNEMYAEVFARTYGFNTIGLRYFNVFGPRQDPNGAYAAVIPKWAAAMVKGEPVFINGDGETSRDFCFVDNVVQANILAAYALDHSAITSDVEQSIPLYSAINQVYNVALGERTTLNELFNLIREDLYKIFRSSERIHAITKLPTYREFREGDVRHSQANISKAKRLLGYLPTHNIKQGIVLTIPWYIR